jgi:hypothetical protein
MIIELIKFNNNIRGSYMFDKYNQEEKKLDNDIAPPAIASIVFFKTIIKEFADGNKIVYMVMSEKGKSLGIFDTIRACKHFAICNNFEYHFVH